MTTEEHIRALREALAAGPTPGPWKPHFEEAYFVTGPDLGRVAMMMNLKGAHGLGGRRSGGESAANCRLIAAAHPAAILAVLAALDEARRDAERYRWLRSQHEGLTDPLQMDADGFPMPQEPTALAFTVFRPDPSGMESLVPVGCIPGELDAAIDAALTPGA